MDVEGSLEHVVSAALKWLATHGEILAIARFSRSAGAREFVLFNDRDRFVVWVSSLPADTNVLVMKDYDLILRGEPASVLAQLPDEPDEEWLLVLQDDDGDTAWECWGTQQLREELQGCESRHVAAGRMPAWNNAVVPDAPTTLSAIVPRSDGSVERGIY